ncbi:OsmC family protein [Maribacter sp. 2210JD10-5]|uniref:OsmC family protein n=1 Tax=Maribacter sp. 2210JD10-5 TaxID=3386272 RepID=UPI0039BC89AA
MKKHKYTIQIDWTGNEGDGTLNYKSYTRSHTISVNGKYDKIMGSSDPSFLGDKTKYNPEELFLASIASCHMLWYLHLCSVHNIVVTDYMDHTTGVMQEDENGSGKFVAATLHPQVKVAQISMIKKAHELHKEANTMCFIANSCNFDIGHDATITT